MWTVCITSIRHVLKLNGYGGRQAKANEKRQRFKGWETLVNNKTLYDDIMQKADDFEKEFNQQNKKNKQKVKGKKCH